MRRRAVVSFLGGATALWPLAVRTQQKAMLVIAFMSGRSPEDSSYVVAAFRQGLAEAGFVEGQNVVIEFRWAQGDYSRLPALATELVSHKPAVLVAVGGDVSAIAAKQATSIVPIVFGMGGDPVRAGLVESLNRPGGNATGFTLLTNEMEPKRLGLLHELLPGADLVGVLLNPSFPPAMRQLTELEEAARAIDQRLFVAKASNDRELATAFAALLQQRVGALLAAADPYFDTRREQITAFASRNRLPAFYHFREYVVVGGLISYGPRVIDGYRQAAIYVGRILKGAKPADLPVVQPTTFELVVNMKAGKALGIAIPPSILARADEVIE
jgi:putative tryptophan/tyrosine transport system substrate-binding protein